MTADRSRAWRARQKEAGKPVHSPERLVKQDEWLASTYRAAREAPLDIVGRVCIGCGHDDSRVIELDHIHDDGAADRCRFKGARSMLTYYGARPVEARERLQPLCRNCNWLKRKGQALPNQETPPC